MAASVATALRAVRISNDVSVVLKGGSCVTMPQLALHNSKRCSCFKQFARCCVSSSPFSVLALDELKPLTGRA